MNPVNSDPVYRPEIDGLRALAVLPVIFFHAGFQLFEGGFVGVDVFFVISGYLITSIILRERESGSFTLAGFYERRARRLLPALFVVLFCCIPFAFLILTPPFFKEFFGLGLVGAATFSSNFLFLIQRDGYFVAANSELNPLIHTWSLAVEEQFYLFYPLLLLFMLRFSRTSLLVVFSFFILFIFLFAVAHGDTHLTFYASGARFWELYIGVILAIILNERGGPLVPENKVIQESTPILGLIMVVAPIFFIKSFETSPHIPIALVVLAPVLGTALIIMFSDRGTFIGRLLSIKPLVGLGLISYSAYLWHQPLLAFYKNLSIGRTDNSVLLLLCLASLILAFASWRFVERPFRDRSRLSRSRVFILSALGCAFFLVIGISVSMNRSKLQIENPNIAESSIAVYQNEIDLTLISHQLSYECSDEAVLGEHDYGWDDLEDQRLCFQSKPEDQADIAIMGDSHALHLFPGLAEGLDQNVVSLWKPGWVRGAPFREENAVFFDYLEKPEGPETILISLWWEKLFILLGREEFERKITETINLLSSKDKRVILVTDIPYLDSQPGACLFLNRVGTDPVCGISRARFEDQRDYLEVLQKFESLENVELIDNVSLFCDERNCSILDQGHLLYWDDDHLNERGSRYFARHIIKESKFL